MMLDYHWINKGCTVEILYGEHRTFLIQKTFKVASLDGPDICTVDVYGKSEQYKTYDLKLLDKPGYTRIKEGKWLANYLVESVK
jgi:hypothetical protein